MKLFIINQTYEIFKTSIIEMFFLLIICRSILERWPRPTKVCENEFSAKNHSFRLRNLI